MFMDQSSETAHTITAADGTMIPVPDEFICPLTLDVMVEPIVSREGHNYEREAILNWVAEHGTSPLTRKPMRPSQLVPNRALQAQISFFLREHGVESSSDASLTNDDDVVENDVNFVGYVVCNKDSKTSQTYNDGPSTSAMSLASLTASALNARRTESQSQAAEHLAERRRRIAELVRGAMRDVEVLS